MNGQMNFTLKIEYSSTYIYKECDLKCLVDGLFSVGLWVLKEDFKLLNIIRRYIKHIQPGPFGPKGKAPSVQRGRALREFQLALLTMKVIQLLSPLFMFIKFLSMYSPIYLMQCIVYHQRGSTLTEENINTTNLSPGEERGNQENCKAKTLYWPQRKEQSRITTEVQVNQKKSTE